MAASGRRYLWKHLLHTWKAWDCMQRTTKQRHPKSKPNLFCMPWWHLDPSNPLRLILHAMPTGHICMARCSGHLVEMGSRCRVEMSAKRKGTAYKQGASYQRNCNSADFQKWLYKQSQMVQLHWKQAAKRKTKGSSTFFLWKTTRSFCKIIIPQNKILVSLSHLLNCILLLKTIQGCDHGYRLKNIKPK